MLRVYMYLFNVSLLNNEVMNQINWIINGCGNFGKLLVIPCSLEIIFVLILKTEYQHNVKHLYKSKLRVKLLSETSMSITFYQEADQYALSYKLQYTTLIY